MMRPSFFLVATLAVVLISVLENQQALSACCHANDAGDCADATTGTPFCGFGSCNLFGCACKGGCRGGRGRVRRGLEMGDQETGHFDRFDVNGDGHLDIHESYKMIAHGVSEENFMGTVHDYKPTFNKYDKDGNGKLSLSEIN